MKKMQTEIEDDLCRDLKILSAKTGVSLKDLFKDGIRLVLDKYKKSCSDR